MSTKLNTFINGLVPETHTKKYFLNPVWGFNHQHSHCLRACEAAFGAALTCPRQSVLPQLCCLGLIASNFLAWQYRHFCENHDCSHRSAHILSRLKAVRIIHWTLNTFTVILLPCLEFVASASPRRYLPLPCLGLASAILPRSRSRFFWVIVVEYS